MPIPRWKGSEFRLGGCVQHSMQCSPKSVWFPSGYSLRLAGNGTQHWFNLNTGKGITMQKQPVS